MVFILHEEREMKMKTPQEVRETIRRVIKVARDYVGVTEPTGDVRAALDALRTDVTWVAQEDEDALNYQYKRTLGRPSTHVYFMNIAQVVATRATCDRKHVGAVIVRDRRIIATGYNGSPPGMPHCDDVGHDIVVTNGRETCVRTVHAEMNAVAQAALYGVSIKDADIYTNTYPCWNCAKSLLSGGIRVVYVDKDYNNDARVEEAFKGRIVRVG
jgi:dCMP deaminase